MFLAIFLLIACRLFYIQIIKHNFYLKRSEDQRRRIISLAADRGDIFDRRGNLLATSVDSFSVYLVPREVKNKEYTANKLSKILGESYYQIINKTYENKPFVWVKRKVPWWKAKRVKDSKLNGIYVLGEKMRVYPKGSLASQVLGFVGIDNQGLSGIEFGLEEYLKGKEGRYITESDPRGREIVSAKTREIQKAESGLNVVLTIDEVVQYICEKELVAAVKKSQAVSGTIVVMDALSGDILALASKPDFDPNYYLKYSNRNWHCRGVQDVYEPGSTFKLITIAAALEEGIVNKETKIYCPDSIVIGGKRIRNSHHQELPSENVSVRDILAYSINTGTAQIGVDVGEDRLMKYIKAFGFGKYADVGIPGETRGIVREVKDWSKPDIGMISFGQAIAVTPLQLTSAVCAIANNGVLMKPRLIKKIESIDGKYVKIFPEVELGRPISKKTALEIKEMMGSVVEYGTGKLAKVKGFSVGGKTGTAQKVKPGGRGYWYGHYISSFIGIVPLHKSRIVILVAIDDPKGVVWGERVAAPVFKKVAEDVLRYLNISPDEKIASLN